MATTLSRNATLKTTVELPLHQEAGSAPSWNIKQIAAGTEVHIETRTQPDDSAAYVLFFVYDANMHQKVLAREDFEWKHDANWYGPTTPSVN
jgi:hypothetical protein